MEKFFFITFLFFNLCISGQDISTLTKGKKKQYHKANEFFEANNFKKATDLFEKIHKIIPNNLEINYKLAYCFLNITSRKKEAIILLEKSVKSYKKKNENYKKAYYLLGKAYHFNYQFSKAIETFKNLQEILKKSEKDFLLEIDNDVLMCKNAIQYIKKQSDISIQNLSLLINSEFEEMTPIISKDGETLIFTSNKKTGHSKKKNEDGSFRKKIYISKKNHELKWSAPEIFTDKIDNNINYISSSVSNDGEQLFVYLSKNSKNYDIFVCDIQGEFWSEPKEIGENVNTKFNETYAYLAVDGKTLYFVSDRKGGFGGKDIYKVKKLPNGNWSKAENLGKTINSPFDEECPYFSEKNILYFSTNSPEISMGGFDICKSKLNEKGDWGNLENLYYPINTIEDDMYFYPTKNEKIFYYCSVKEDSKGKMDIYFVNIFDEKEKYKTVFSGNVELENKTNYEDIEISIKNKKTNKLVGIYKTNPKTGKYLFILENGKYSVNYHANEYEDFKFFLEVKRENSYKRIKKTISLKTQKLIFE